MEDPALVPAKQLALQAGVKLVRDAFYTLQLGDQAYRTAGTVHGGSLHRTQELKGLGGWGMTLNGRTAGCCVPPRALRSCSPQAPNERTKPLAQRHWRRRQRHGALPTCDQGPVFQVTQAGRPVLRWRHLPPPIPGEPACSLLHH